MRLSGAGRAALLVLLAAHFQTSLALEEKRGKDARAAVLPVPGGRAFRRAAEECASRFRAAGQPRARDAGRRAAQEGAGRGNRGRGCQGRRSPRSRKSRFKDWPDRLLST